MSECDCPACRVPDEKLLKNRPYTTSDGHRCGLWEMCRREPEWAGNTIERLKQELAEAVRVRDERGAVMVGWQRWAAALLDDLGRQPLRSPHNDTDAQEVIAQLAGMAPGVPRCLCCGCFSTRHEPDDEELCGCAECECDEYEAP